MDDKFEILDSENGENIITSGGFITKLSKLHEAVMYALYTNETKITEHLDNSGGGKLNIGYVKQLVEKTLTCQVLKPGKNWQNGKCRIKVSIEFCPDEPEITETPDIKELESPLDDLRRQINDLSS